MTKHVFDNGIALADVVAGRKPAERQGWYQFGENFVMAFKVFTGDPELIVSCLCPYKGRVDALRSIPDDARDLARWLDEPGYTHKQIQLGDMPVSYTQTTSQKVAT